MAAPQEAPAVQPNWGRFEIWLIPAAIAVMLVVIFVGIGRSIWLDEALSISTSQLDFSDLIGRLEQENNFPLYFLLLHFWRAIFGDSAAALRLLSGLFYAGAVLAIYLVGVGLFSEKRAALYSALCYLISTQASRSAQNIRTYELLGFVAAVSTMLFTCLSTSQTTSRRNWILFTTTNAIGLFAHLWYGFLLPAQLAAVLLWRRDRLKAFLASMVLSALPFALLWTPVLWGQLHNRESDWFPPLQLSSLLHAVMDFYGWRLALVFYGACVALIVPGFLRQGSRGLSRDRILFTCFAVSLGLPLFLSVFKPIYYPGRYTIIALPALAAWLGSLLARYAPQQARVALSFAMLAAVAVIQIRGRQVNLGGDTDQYSERATAEFLLRQAGPGDSIIFTGMSRPVVDYYFARAGAGSRFFEISFPPDPSHPAYPDMAVTRRPAELQADAALVASRLQDGRDAGSRRVWLVYGYDQSTASPILKSELDRRFVYRASANEVGRKDTSVLEYLKPEIPPPTSPAR